MNRPPNKNESTADRFLIDELNIDAYGKFRKKVFQLEKTTLFIGPNESGKSTIFDAIFDTLTSPKGTTAAAKRLSSRYGKDRKAKLGFTDSEIQIDPDEFENILSIGSDDISIRVNDGQDWIDRIKSSLFSGGIDPSRIASALEKLTETRLSTNAGKASAELEQKKDRLKKNIGELNKIREEILGKEKQYEAESDRVLNLEKEIARGKQQHHVLNSYLKLQESLRERKMITSVLYDLTALQEAEKQLAGMNVFQTDESEILGGLVRKCGTVEKELDLGRSKLDTLEKELQILKEEADRKKAAVLPIIKAASCASEIKIQLDLNPPKPVQNRKTDWNIRLLLAGTVLALLLTASAVFIFPQPLSWGAGGFGAFIFIIFLVFSRKLRIQEDHTPVIQTLRIIREQWNTKISESPLTAETVEGIKSELTERINRREILENGIAEAEARSNEKTKNIDSIRQSIRTSEKEMTDSRNRLGEWLSQRGLKNPDEYGHQRFLYTEAAKKTRSLGAVCLEHQGSFNARDSLALRSACESRLRQLTEDLPLSEPDPASLFQAKQAEADRLREKMEKAGAEKESLAKSLFGGMGEIRGQLGDLPRRIASLEEELEKISLKLVEKQIEREAAGRGARIFREIASDSTAMFEELSRDISSLFEKSIGEDRKIKLSSIDMTEAFITDKGGNMRPFHHLSSGTRGSFLFAAKLMLSRKAAQAGILILDDPFRDIDTERVRRMIALCSTFQKETNTQIILFSKDNRMEELVGHHFPNALVHYLKDQQAPPQEAQGVEKTADLL